MTEKTAYFGKMLSPESIWAGKEVFPTWDDWDEEFEAVQAELPGLAEFEGRLLDDPANLVRMDEDIPMISACGLAGWGCLPVLLPLWTALILRQKRRWGRLPG